MAPRYAARSAHNPGQRLNPRPAPRPSPSPIRPVSPRPPIRTNPLQPLPSAFPRGRGKSLWDALPGPKGAGLILAAGVMVYYDVVRNYPPQLTPDGPGHFLWKGWHISKNSPEELPAESPCHAQHTYRVAWCQSTPATPYLGLYADAIPCGINLTARKGPLVQVLQRYPCPADPGSQFDETVPKLIPPGAAPFPGPSPWGDPRNYPSPRPDGLPDPLPRPRPRPRPLPRPRTDITEVGITIEPGKPPVVVPKPQPRPPTGPTKERKVHGKIGAVATAVFWLWEMVDDARDWRDIILDAKKAGDGRPIPKGEFDKWAAIADPSTFANLDPRTLIEGIAEFYVEEFVGKKLSDFEKQFAAMVDSPLTSKWGVTSGQDWGLDSERGGSAIKEALDWLSAQYDAFAEE